MVKIFLLLFFVGLNCIQGYDESFLNNQKSIIIDYHTIYRYFHQVDELTHSSELDEIAQKHSDFLSKNPDKFILPSKNTYKGSKLGENKYLGELNIDFGYKVLSAWYSESELYFSNPENKYFAPHFSQLVWKSSKLIGCGVSSNTTHGFVVCNYFPAGNIVNEYDNNVFPMTELEWKDDNMILAEDVSDSKTLEKFRNEITERHNYYRKKHNVGELERDSKLEKIAQEVVENMANIDSIYYTSEKYNEETIGQSFYYNTKFSNGKEVADEWYSQKKNYDFENPTKKNLVLIKGFTNLVWKDTKKIGCSYTCKDKDKQCYYCCAYYPGGIDSILLDNILPIKKEE